MTEHGEFGCRGCYEDGYAFAMKVAADELQTEAERIKHTRHMDGLGMGWIDGEELLIEMAARLKSYGKHDL